jgi:hypothetical protein
VGSIGDITSVELKITDEMNTVYLVGYIPATDAVGLKIALVMSMEGAESKQQQEKTI